MLGLRARGGAATSRVAGIDLARGLAVVGMFGAHVLTTVPWQWNDPATWTDIVNGRASILFATLAGLSLALLTGGEHPIEGAALRVTRGRIAVRAVIIWAIGMVLIALATPVYVILPAYGILFLLAIPLLRVPPGWLAAGALSIAVVMPFILAEFDSGTEPSPGNNVLFDLTGWAYPFPLWLAFIAIGLALGRVGVHQVSVALAAVLLGGGAAVLGYAVLPMVATGPWMSVEAHSGGVAEVVGSGGFAVAVVGLCVLLCHTPLRILVWPLRAMGSMPLTAYVVQLVIWWWVEREAGSLSESLMHFRSLEPMLPLTLGIMAGCCLWSLLFRRGPLEAVIAWVAARVVTGRRELRSATSE